MELEKLLLPENVELGCRFGTWRECVERAGFLLERDGCITRAYTDDMISMLQDMGPYIVIMPGVALAHARPNGNVIKNGISLITLKDGVFFGNADNDPAYAVFAIAACSDEMHLVLFKSVGKFLADEEKVEALKKARRFEDIKF